MHRSPIVLERIENKKGASITFFHDERNKFYFCRVTDKQMKKAGIQFREIVGKGYDDTNEKYMKIAKRIVAHLPPFEE